MDERKEALMYKAWVEHGDIEPCSSKVSLMDCFTIEGKALLFWFNTSDNSTHLLKEES